jgi:hypothetical protein
LTGVAGKHIYLTDNTATGYQGDTGFSVVLDAASPLVHISGTGANTTISISPNANFNWALSSNYTIAMDAGAFTDATAHVNSVALGTSNAGGTAASTGVSFNTVTPAVPPAADQGADGIAFTAASVATGAAGASYTMNSQGQFVSSNVWVDITNVGNGSASDNTQSLPTPDALPELSLDGGANNTGYTVVFADSNSTGGDLVHGRSGVIPYSDLAINLTNVNSSDRIYVNDQFRNASNLNNFFIDIGDIFGLGGDGLPISRLDSPLAWQFPGVNPTSHSTTALLEVTLATNATVTTDILRNSLPDAAGNTSLADVNQILGLSTTASHYNSLIIGG